MSTLREYRRRARGIGRMARCDAHTALAMRDRRLGDAFEAAMRGERERAEGMRIMARAWARAALARQQEDRRCLP